MSIQLQNLISKVAISYVSTHEVAPCEIGNLIAQITAGLNARPEPLLEAVGDERGDAAKPTAAQIRKSITPEWLISFENGKPYRALRRHLARRGLTPQQYRAKWGLPDSYPMVSVSSSALRSAVALRIGLGTVHKRPRGSRNHLAH